jgi:hypothetical protein
VIKVEGKWVEMIEELKGIEGDLFEGEGRGKIEE